MSIKDSDRQPVSDDDTTGARGPLQHGVAVERFAERADSDCYVLQHAAASPFSCREEMH